jgi:hypothetical protein
MSDEYDRALHSVPQRAELTQRTMTRHYIVGDRRKFINDTLVPGFALMLTPKGSKSLVFRYRFGGKTDKITFKTTSVEEARKLASAARGTLQDGDNPRFREPGSRKGNKTLREVVTDYLRSRPKDYRSGPEMLASFENHVKALLGRPIESLDRDVTVPLVDEVAHKYRHAANTLARNLNAVGRWYEKRTPKFVWPTVPSPLTKEERRPRDRVLEDHELAAVWRAAERQGYPHGKLIQFLLLSALRRKEAAHLSRAEVAADYSQLKLPLVRVKTKVAFTLPLSKAAAAVLRSCPEGEWFFAGSRDGQPYWNFARHKTELDRQLNIPHWTLHDLRRTAATLMVRAGVLPHVVEKVLNHVTPGIAGVYQHHNWLEEKRDALERLARLLAKIVEGSATAK